ncbi:MAG: ABC transporter substrate binding protein, partial [Anaerotignaceae bacterium]
MKKSIKTLGVALLTIGAMAVTGCSSSTGATTANEQATTGEDILNVGIIQLIDNGAFEDMREGFIQQLKDKGYDESKVNINYKNAQGDATNLNTISQEMVASNMDLIAAIATPSAQAIVNMETDIPVVFISISNPVGAGIITDMAKPDKNATGTSNAIPVNEIID